MGGEDEAPPLPRFPEFEDESDGVRFNMTYTWPCNWVNSLENDPFRWNDGRHTAIIAAPRFPAGPDTPGLRHRGPS